MPKIRAFQGIRYNPEKVDLSKAICPPYDVISPQQMEELYTSEPHNAIRLEYGRQSPKDSKTDNRYTRAKADLDSWLKKGILIREKKPAIYYHEHTFLIGDKSHMRAGFIAPMRIDEEGTRTILPHEITHKGPKLDRLRLLNETRVNLSCVFGIYSDPTKLVESQIRPSLGEPDMDVVTGNEGHKVWVITEKKMVEQISAMMIDKKILIADGHHRYETARGFRDRMRATTGIKDGNQGFDYVMTYFSNMDAGLQILPTHRVIPDSMGVGLVDLEYRIKEIFNMVPYDNRKTFLQALHDGGQGHIGLYVSGIQRYYLLELLEGADLDRYLSPDTEPQLKKLDVNILHKCIIEPILGIDPSMAAQRIHYVSDDQEALTIVEQEKADIAFLLNPTTPRMVMDIAAAGSRMPQKSTYFYPKIPTGLAFHGLE